MGTKERFWLTFALQFIVEAITTLLKEWANDDGKSDKTD